jgi:Fe-Mn family superoxide dismutase
MAHEVPPLPYAYNALEPHIDEQTMRIHHDKHHAAYVNNLNTALEKHPDLQRKSVEELIKGINTVPDEIRTAVRNNGGGHVNHTMFWEIMGPGKGGQPGGAVGDAIKSSFGSFDAFKEQFAKAATTRFGSGWAWLLDVTISSARAYVLLPPGFDVTSVSVPATATSQQDGRVSLQIYNGSAGAIPVTIRASKR